ncbi:MAG: hypothetical protein ABIO46_03990 [Chitinophagales bacterium]
MNTIKSVTAVLLIATAAFISSCGVSEEKKTANADSAAMAPITTVTATESDEAEESHEVGKQGAGPHKGIVEEAGEANHAEMVVSGKDIVFYPLDDKTDALDTKGWSGKVIMQYADGDTKTMDLKMMDNMLMAMGANTGEKFKAIVTLANGSTSISSEFSSEGGMHNDGHEHTH